MTIPASISPEMLDYAKTLFAEVRKDKNGIEGFCNFQGMTMAEYKDICPSFPVDDFDLFLQYLMSPKSNAVATISIDSSYPISDYFVSTSHNTYLWGNQLYGHASTDAYRNVSYSMAKSPHGARCVDKDRYLSEVVAPLK